MQKRTDMKLIDVIMELPPSQFQMKLLQAHARNPKPFEIDLDAVDEKYLERFRLINPGVGRITIETLTRYISEYSGRKLSATPHKHIPRSEKDITIENGICYAICECGESILALHWRRSRR